MTLQRFIIILSIIGILIPSFSFAQLTEAPKTLDDAKGVSLDILGKLPDAIKKVWNNEAWPFILKMWTWAKDVWDKYLGDKVGELWQKFLDFIGKKAPDLQKEFEKERTEMQQDAPKVGNSLWQKFKELID